jgi:hypothetical protein
MMTFDEAAPTGVELAAAVGDREYARLLGWPRERPFDGRVAEGVQAARAWFATMGGPWVGARRVAVQRIDRDAVRLETGAIFHGGGVSRRLEQGAVHALVAVALTAGEAVEQEAKRLWADDKPDESYFLDRFGAAVAEELLRWASAWICRDAESRGETVLFHLSPGCGGWPFEEQPTVMGLLADAGARNVGPVTMLESGGLVPSHSLLAVLALTKDVVAPTSASDACRGCDLTRCAFRRAPYRRIA